MLSDRVLFAWGGGGGGDLYIKGVQIFTQMYCTGWITGSRKYETD